MYVKRRSPKDGEPTVSGIERFVASTCQRFANVRDHSEDPVVQEFHAKAFVVVDRARLLAHAPPALRAPAVPLKALVRAQGTSLCVEQQ